MATRMVVNGKAFWTNLVGAPRREVQNLQRDGSPLDHAPVVGKAQAPAVGGHIVDSTDGITYRVLAFCDPALGWATIEHWMHYFGVKHTTVWRWVQLGFFDAAMELHSPTKRYRCTSHARVHTWLTENPALKLSTRSVYRHKKFLPKP